MQEIELHLKYLLNSTTLTVTNIKPLMPSNSTTFSKKYLTTRRLRLYTQPVSSISNNIEVPILGVPIDFKQTTHKVFLAEIAVGNTLYVARDVGYAVQPPSHYDTFIVPSNRFDFNSEITDIKVLQDEDLINLSFSEKSSSFSRNSDSSILEKRTIGNSKNENIFSNLEKSSSSSNLEKRQIGNSKNIDLSVINDSLIKDQSFEENKNCKSFSYLLKDSSRILPLYEITFNYDHDLEMKSRNSSLCEMCQSFPSIMFCLAERASFCINCDKNIHCNEFTMRHKRYYYEKVGLSNFISCIYHPDSVVDYVCMKCCVPVCCICRMAGNHQGKEHELLEYLEACKILNQKIIQVVGKSEIDQNIENKNEEENENNYENKINSPRKNKNNFNYENNSSSKIQNSKLELFLNNCDLKMKILYEKYYKSLKSSFDVRKKVEEMYRKSLNEISGWEKKKFQILNAGYIEWNRLKDEGIRIKKYVDTLEKDGGRIVKEYLCLIQSVENVSKSECVVVSGNDNINVKGEFSVVIEEKENFYEERKEKLKKSTEMYVETRESKR
ncbi:hypothetical protein CWI36_1040p0030 [Hamiltosporidium magnivora]|uniref:B box-type domain-containing protein n=1 Tax=Hamiltosporidium magnivora TaxID=148818 RepID=A0A4Q9L5F7_9MICR|nr:hypothetical protein CWI36_1040p0030 [Hamiltosporidium magnivora]